MKRILVLGANSAIAQGAEREASRQGDALFLVARNEEHLAQVADDLRVRGASQVHTLAADLTDATRHEAILDAAEAALGSVDGALVAHGVLTDQPAAERDPEVLRRDFDVNFLSAASLLTHLANRFEARGSGALVVISSVAGDRGRQSNYAYGSAKAALSAFASGLRNRLAKSRVTVTTVKAGFVDTPMTAHVAKNALFASAGDLGRAIYRCFDKPRDVVYLPWFWRPIMGVVRAVPERLFKQMKL